MFSTDQIKDYRLRRLAIVGVIVGLTLPTILFYVVKAAIDTLEEVVREVVCYAPAEIRKQWRKDYGNGR